MLAGHEGRMPDLCLNSSQVEDPEDNNKTISQENNQNNFYSSVKFKVLKQ